VRARLHPRGPERGGTVTIAVAIRDFVYEPATLTVAPGGMVA
jgi:plastocyanin